MVEVVDVVLETSTIRDKERKRDVCRYSFFHIASVAVAILHPHLSVDKFISAVSISRLAARLTDVQEVQIAVHDEDAHGR
ncbi:MAG: hypothetical protein ACLQCB_02395 [Spirochaetia bacterium]